ncbi:MAG: hypothetical protein OEM62_06375 [Acidobacteriota bacterium]|nr:hypothetical protein [Acidobacteriota bacterium]
MLTISRRFRYATGAAQQWYDLYNSYYGRLVRPPSESGMMARVWGALPAEQRESVGLAPEKG